jgi:hypothetical protein
MKNNKKTITAKYKIEVPYNRKYVGISFSEPIITKDSGIGSMGFVSMTDHYDGINNNCWQGAISAIITPLLEDYNIEYIDKDGATILFTKGDNVEEILKEKCKN